jgi:hypothetical protein
VSGCCCRDFMRKRERFELPCTFPVSKANANYF